MSQKTFETYLRESHANGVIDHTLRAHVEPNGAVKFYIHACGTDSDTLDFVVGGNGLSLIDHAMPRATAVGTVDA